MEKEHLRTWIFTTLAIALATATAIVAGFRGFEPERALFFIGASWMGLMIYETYNINWKESIGVAVVGMFIGVAILSWELASMTILPFATFFAAPSILKVLRKKLVQKKET
jgi:hypothetical protein